MKPRWNIILLLMALCFISHMNRVSMSVAADERIMKQFSLSPTQMGVVYSAFLVVYTLAMIPGGLFIDRFGVRLALTVMGLGSGLLGAATGLVGFGAIAAAQIWMALIAVRSVMGLLTVPLHPGAARAVALAVPEPRRALANGLVTGAALFGIACTYKVFGALIDRFDWPGAFCITGAVTMLLTLVWTFVGKGLNRESSGSPATDANGRDLARLFRNRSLWLLTLSYAAIGYFQYLFFYWMHYYLENVLRFGKEESRWYAGVPVFAMAVAMPLGGLISDRLLPRLGERRARAGVAACGMGFSVIFLALGVVGTTPLVVVGSFALALAALGLSEGPFWLSAVAVGGNRGGTAAAIMNTGGNGIGLLAPVITPVVSARFGWQWGFALAGIVCLLGALCWAGIKAERER